MEWEIREHDDGTWGVYLLQKYCKTNEPVCFGTSRTLEGAEWAVKSLTRETHGVKTDDA